MLDSKPAATQARSAARASILGLDALGARSWLILWAVLVAAPLLLRAPLPPDELRYLGIAWEMWSHGNWLVPHLNGVPYSEKPPLLFWLIHVGWAAFGVNDWWPRVLPGLFALSAVVLTRAFCKALWPDNAAARAMLPWLLLGSFAFVLYTQVVMFDLLLANCTLLALLGFVRAARHARGGWLLIAVATALGLLSKGPVMLIHVAVPWLLGPWWAGEKRPQHWQLRAGAAVLSGGLVALAWALLAGRIGGPDYAGEILLRQTAGRVVDSFAHAQPFWFYVAIMPVLLLPWSALPTAWRAIRSSGSRAFHDAGWRLAVLAIIVPFIALSALSGKQPHYLLPLMAPCAAVLAVALSLHRKTDNVSAALPAMLTSGASAAIALMPLSRGADDLMVAPWSPAWGLVAAACLAATAASGSLQAVVRRVALAAPLLTLAFETAFFRANGAAFDTAPAAAVIAELQDRNVPLAHSDRYEGEFHFPGRLLEPLSVIGEDDTAVDAWFGRHPDGYVIRKFSDQPSDAAYCQRLRGKWLAIVRSRHAVADSY
jgi:4-amino-4-deoxy-L-arabinose transferase-like glycosyltransferase